MKERIVIDFKDLKCAEDKNYVIAKKEKCKIEKYPTNWEELEKLVIDNCNNYTISIDKNKKRYSIECKGFIFYNFGLVEFSITTKTIDNDCVKFNRCLTTEMQPQQMWNIIKSLIGEE